jgi:ABC-type phosphate/phosphonate transport system ATPase subunit
MGSKTATIREIRKRIVWIGNACNIFIFLSVQTVYCGSEDGHRPTFQYLTRKYGRAPKEEKETMIEEMGIVLFAYKQSKLISPAQLRPPRGYLGGGRHLSVP